MSGMVEREHELALLSDLVDRSAHRGGACLLIEGAAGLGKSTLLAHAATIAVESGMTVAAARGAELEQDLPYSTVRELFDQLLRRRADLRDELFDGPAQHAAALFGYGHGPINPAAVEHALYWLVANLAEHAELLVVVDDAQWCDEASIRFLRYLIQRIADLPVALVIGTRDRAPFAGLPYDTSVLAPLSEQAVGHVLHQALVAPVDAEFRRECARLTGGNPFLVAEVVATLRALRTTPSAAAVPGLAAMSPETVQRSVLGRIANHGPHALGVARSIAVLGADATVPLISGLTGGAGAEIASIVERLRRDGVLEMDGPVVGFTHPLLRSVVYEDLGAIRAAEHRRAATLLQAADRPLETQVPHLLAAMPTGDHDVVETLLAAADHAMESAAPEVAAQCLQRALTEPPPRDQVPSIRRRLGSALSTANRMPEALAAYDAALNAATSQQERNDIAVDFGWLLMMLGLGEQATKVLRNVSAADAFVDLSTGIQAALTVAGLAAMESPRDWTQRMDTVDESRITGPDRQLFFANLAFAATACGDRPAGEVVRIATAALADPVDPRHRFIVVNSLCPALTISDAAPDALRLLDNAIDDASIQGDLGAWRYFVVMRARISPEVGDLMGAEADGRAIYELDNQELDPPVVPLSAAMLVEALLDRGHVDEAARIGQALTDPPPVGIMAHFVLLARGRLRRHLRQYDDALADLHLSGRQLTEHGYTNPGFLLWRTEAALTHLDLGDLPRAAELAAEHVELAREFGAARAIGIGLWVQALAAESTTRRLELLTEAQQVLQHSNTILPRVRVEIDLGAALRRAGHRIEAVQILNAALVDASRCYADGLIRRIQEELAATGVTPRRSAVVGPAALTAGELRVATYAAEGLTNREIAQRLFVSKRTVELHLTNTFRKLGVESRRQLAAVLAR